MTARTGNLGSGCWVWEGYTKNGYGSLSIGNEDRYIHRLSHEIHHGPVPDGYDVCHSCDVPRCWAPHHLFAGTRQENVADAQTKGRAAAPPPPVTGQAHHLATLSDEDVAAVRGLRGTRPQRELARAFRVSQSTISRLQRGEVRSCR